MDEVEDTPSGTPGAQTDGGRVGAYGLSLAGLLPSPRNLLGNVPADWPSWTVSYEWSAGRPSGDWTDRLDGQTAVVALGAGTARLDRRTSSTVLALPQCPSAAELAHPYLAATGAVAARWRGDLPLHGGAFVAGERAWGLLGDREAGKSTTVAALWRARAPILTDDLIVLRGRTVLAGPRSLDLREPTAAWLGVGDSIGVVGMRERWRIQLDQVPAETSLGGFVVLEWGPDVALTPLPAAERPAALMAALAVLALPTSPAALLEVFTLPIWRLTRPRRLSALDSATALLLETLGGA